jgi:hypothetical protein
MIPACESAGEKQMITAQAAITADRYFLKAHPPYNQLTSISCLALSMDLKLYVYKYNVKYFFSPTCVQTSSPTKSGVGSGWVQA